MANTTTTDGNFIEITLDGSTDWRWDADMDAFFRIPTGVMIRSIGFKPSAANDVMVIRENGVDGAAIFSVKCADTTDDRVKYFNPPRKIRPVIDATDITLGTAANARVYLELA